MLKNISFPVGQIFACGPRQMLQFVSMWAKEHSIPIQVSMEERMACGIGACLGCGVKIQKPGEPDWKYLKEKNNLKARENMAELTLKR